MCKLHYLQFGFQKRRNSRSKRYFKIVALKDFAIFTGTQLCLRLFLINIQAWSFIKRSICSLCVFLWNKRNFKSTSFLKSKSGGCFWKYLMKSLFIAFENNEWCHFMVCIGSPAFISFYCVCFIFFYFFRFFLFLLWILLLFGFRLICQYLKQSGGVVPRFLSGVSRGELFQPYLVITPDLVQFGKNLSYILPPLTS